MRTNAPTAGYQMAYTVIVDGQHVPVQVVGGDETTDSVVTVQRTMTVQRTETIGETFTVASDDLHL